MDDDIITSRDDTEFGLEIWQVHNIVQCSRAQILNHEAVILQKFRNLIIGFEGRTRTFSILKDGTYFYGIANETELMVEPEPGSYSIMLPGLFIHRAYLEMLFDPMMVPSEYVEFTDEMMNCEDILLSMMVTRFVGDTGLPWSGGLAIEPQKPIEIEILDLSPSKY